MNLNELKALKTQFNEAVKTNAKPAIAEMLKAIFDANPTVEEVRWEQYTPYFNDGDSCEFSIHEPEVRINGGDDEDGDHGDGYVSTWYLKDDEPPLLKASLKAFYVDAQQLEELFEGAFGDHMQVTAYRDGRVEANEYSHD